MRTVETRVGFVCFGEVNTPIDRLQKKHDAALSGLKTLGVTIIDAGLVVDDPKYATAKTALAKLRKEDMDCLIVCVAGWVPTHAVVYVTDELRHTPMVLWGLCGWYHKGRLVTTADQAGATALRPVFEDMGYKCRYIYSIVGNDLPLGEIHAFIKASHAVRQLRTARIGTMGYRDMLLYGTQFEGVSLRKKLGIEVEPFEMLEMVQHLDHIDPKDVGIMLDYVKTNWNFELPCDDEILVKGITYALAIGKKIEERGFDAITLLDVDGMKKLLGFPPAMTFMLLDHFYGVQTIPENDILGAVTQLISANITGTTAPYLEYYEFFEKSMLVGVPDFMVEDATSGPITVLPTAFGLLSKSLLNVSKVKTGEVTCSRLIYRNGAYLMHSYTGVATTPPAWVECGWEDPVPQLPSLEIFPHSCTVKEFSQLVSSQHVIVSYTDVSQSISDFCYITDVKLL
ncbi:MAG: hypothetical protein PHR58_04475 [Sphaerochaetaceae bacterium]|nr:hypothetical protein [Sphaerochaetaceae bacterium]